VEAVAAVAAVAQNVHSRSSCSGSTTSDSRYSLNFRTIEPVLHSSRSVEVEEEVASFICCERNTPSIAKAERISLDQVLAVEFLNFASFVPVLHSSRSVGSNQGILPVESLLGSSQRLN